MDYVAVIAAVLAGVAGGVAWARSETIKHQQATIDYMRGARANAQAPGDQRKQISNGGFVEPNGQRA